MASICTQTWTYPSVEVTRVDLAFDCNDGSSFAAYALNSFTGFVFMAISVPDGTKPPTTGYDVEFIDEDGIDIFGGELHDRSATLKEQVVPGIGSVFGARFVDGASTMTIANNIVSGAKGIITLFILNNANDSN